MKYLHRLNCLQKSSSFFNDLVLKLTESNNADRYNINGHLVPFCRKNQIFDILSRWSIERLEQIDCSSVFYSKLIRYQPSIVIHLVKGDLKEQKKNNEKFSNYFQEKQNLFELIAKKVPKEFIELTIEYLKQLQKHQRFLPQIIQLKQNYFFKKVPDEMIELTTIASSNQPGSINLFVCLKTNLIYLGKIKCKTYWNSQGSEFGSFVFPRSFSIENYLRLFFALYEKCNWSTNDTIRLFQYMLQNQFQHLNLYSLKKQRKWLIEIVIEQRIGKDLFLNKLLKEGNWNTLQLFERYPQLTKPLSIHLISQAEQNGIVEAKQRLSLIRYQLMNEELFQEFLSLFKQTGSDVHQRQKNYPLFFQCALSTNEEYLKKVLQWIEKRFTNEQIIVIEHFISQLSTLNNQFHLKILPNNIQPIGTIIDLAINHLQQSINTITIIISYGILLLKCAEHHQNKQEKDNVQQFATTIIKK